METLRQRVVVPRNRQVKVTLDLPDSVPEGDADLLVVVTSPGRRRTAAEIMRLAGALAGSPRWGGDPLAIQRALRDEWN